MFFEGYRDEATPHTITIAPRATAIALASVQNNLRVQQLANYIAESTQLLATTLLQTLPTPEIRCQGQTTPDSNIISTSYN